MLFLPGFVAIACVASCAPPVPIKRLPVAARLNGTGEALSNQVFIEVNHYRNDRNKLSLRRDRGLDRLAHEHAEYLLRNRGKYGPKVSDANHNGFGWRAERAQMTMGYGRVAENVVCSRRGSAATLVRLWSQSKPHQRAMVDLYQYTGIGTVVDGDGMVFSVEMFGANSTWNGGGNLWVNRF